VADPPLEPERIDLGGGSWVDLWRRWLGPDGLGLPDGETYAEFVRDLPWSEGRTWRYDHWVVEPRLGASLRRGGKLDHPAVRGTARLLRRRYGVTFDPPAAALYRDGRDALGAHRDRELRYTSDTLTGILTLGARRPWTLTPVGRRPPGAEHLRGRLRPEATLDLAPGDGDLFVLGGRAQADWLHAVPPVPGLIDGRISLQWRWTSRTGPPERGPGYRAPRNYSA
jgi:alkylated DNA repair dioxygenase AlkB